MNKILLFGSLLLIVLWGCRNNKPVYLTYDDYPPYMGEDLGLTFGDDETRFTLWAPSADAVELLIYDSGEGGKPERTIAMNRAVSEGPWRTELQGKPYGKFYTYRIQVNGLWLGETPGIWTKAVGVNGNRAAIIDMEKTNPEGWADDKRPPLKNFSDIILYEMHFRDFSIDTTSGIRNRGKFLALTETGTVSPQGLKTGIDHLKELGITHVHILPSFDFGSIDETKLFENKYNWGYDPKNYNVPEGSYSTDPYDPSVRIREMKQMVQALHKNGIRVIMDVVYNHTYVNDNSNFSLTVPGYFYRHNPDSTYSDASNCGNETASEREMMRSYIIESARYWVEEFHIDGFRFDLMGIHDLETMNGLRYALDQIDPTLFVYGEGWTAGPSPYPEELRAVKANAPQMDGIAVFNDDVRDAVKGSYKNDSDKGFVSGGPGLEESVKFGIVAATQHPQVDYGLVNYSEAPYAVNPFQSINYVSSHDDLCLVDKLKVANPSGTPVPELIRQDKLAQTIIFTSQGIPFMFNGEEIFRSKQGVHNSFESPDAINQIDWSDKSLHFELFAYYRDLIALRKGHPAFRIPTADGIRKHLRFIDTGQSGVIAYQLGEYANGDEWKDILLVFNGNARDKRVTLPAGDWTIVADDGKINEKGLGKSPGGTVAVKATSALILKQ